MSGFTVFSNPLIPLNFSLCNAVQLFLTPKLREKFQEGHALLFEKSIVNFINITFICN